MQTNSKIGDALIFACHDGPPVQNCACAWLTSQLVSYSIPPGWMINNRYLDTLNGKGQGRKREGEGERASERTGHVKNIVRTDYHKDCLRHDLLAELARLTLIPSYSPVCFGAATILLWCWTTLRATDRGLNLKLNTSRLWTRRQTFTVTDKTASWQLLIYELLHKIDQYCWSFHPKLLW